MMFRFHRLMPAVSSIVSASGSVRLRMKKPIVCNGAYIPYIVREDRRSSSIQCLYTELDHHLETAVSA